MCFLMIAMNVLVYILQHDSPRTRAEILGRPPPVTPSESELESEQPDSEPVGDAAALDVPAIPVIPAGQTANCVAAG